MNQSAGLFYAYCVGWLVAYFVGTLISSGVDKSYRLKWTTRLVSSFHAIIVSGYAIYRGDDAQKWPYDDCILLFTASYLCMDGCILIFGSSDHLLGDIIHHAAGCGGMLGFYYYQKLHWFAMYFMLTEITTPPLNLMWFQLRTGSISKWLAITTFILFFWVRFIPIPFLIKRLWDERDVVMSLPTIGRFIALFGAGSIFSLNFFWTFRFGMKILDGIRNG